MIQSDTARDDASSPARNSYAVTPHDTNEIGTYMPKALYVGVGGTIVMELDGDVSSTTFLNVPSGAILPVRARVILATGTTATNILAIY